MKLSANGYYVEKYLKCGNCGTLLFEGRNGHKAGAYCSDWCRDWAHAVASGETPRVAPPATPRTPRKEDMVEMTVVDGILSSICREMGVTLMRTSYSSLFSESEDFSCALATPDGEMIANGDFCPSQIGGIPLLVQTMVKETPLETIEEGDVILHNDPYRGGLHTPEHTVFKPIFFDGRIVAFAVAVGHFVEVGGIAAGGFPGDATEIFHEGLRVPPVKIIKRGKDDPDVWRLLLAQVRTPRMYYGDLRAMISAVSIAERRMHELCAKYGVERLNSIVRALLDYSERRTRAEIARIPDGVYTFTDRVEDDGIEPDREYVINVAIHIEGDNVVVDFTGSSPQAKGPINTTLGVAWSAAFNAFLHITDQTIPKNSGCYRPIKVIAPPGTIMNVNYPGSEVGGNTETHPLVVCAIFGALSKAVPDRIMAAEGATHGCITFGGYSEGIGEAFAGFDLCLVGYGARSFADGNSTLDSINGNCAATPVEVFETKFPWRVEEYSLRPDSGGAGKYRGGLGQSRTLRALQPISMNQMSNRHRLPAWGLESGKEGKTGATLFLLNGSARWQDAREAYGRASSSKYSNIKLVAGDTVKVLMPGGGGYGDPLSRAHDLVREDVADGYVSEAEASRLYGYSPQGNG